MSFLFFQNLGMIVGHVYTVKYYFIIQYLEYENQLSLLLGSGILLIEVPNMPTDYMYQGHPMAIFGKISVRKTI